jgi:predicted nucleic acid-binding protein
MTSDGEAVAGMPVAVLDACVLYQGWLTDLLLWLAEAGAFEPVWSNAIHAEWMRNLQSRPDIPVAKIEYRRSEMDKAFPAANVTAPLALVSDIQAACRNAAQRNDAHVVATAVAAGATVIVTHNIKDFAPAVLSRHGMSKIRADPFCVELLAANQARVLAGLRAHRASMRRTPMGPDQYLAHLDGDKLAMRKLARALMPHRGSI